MRVNCCVLCNIFKQLASNCAVCWQLPLSTVSSLLSPLTTTTIVYADPDPFFDRIRRAPEQNCQETITEYCITVFYYTQYIYSLFECSFEAKIKEGRLHRTLQQSSTSYCTYMLNGHPLTHNMLNRTPYKPQFEMLPSHLQYIQQVNGTPYHPQQVKQDTLPPTTGKLYCRGK